jgi:hypothetical protein
MLVTSGKLLKPHPKSGIFQTLNNKEFNLH